ncbi:HPr kinase [Mucilaginibacter paludis]|uniref:HPr kinase n=1 Tax=Mucilaginibacter paludis DSM 18603 TaxID=714943 RepID=H1Y2B5_9SPHI|nr:HPr kinase [Mucilaginibacter paludis]EHQ27895.1 HPr kinase [Mucilaginibacter paludis DSM 18603]
MYHYWGFGLHILSEIEFPELLPFEFDVPDVTIRFGKTPETLQGDDVVHRVRVSMSPNEYLLKTLGIASYYAANGNKIIIEPLDDVDEKSVRLFLLSNAFAAILHQRSVVPLHASAIIANDGLILICGNSKAGKSTLLKALNLDGFEIFSDDICVLNKSKSNDVVAYSSYPMLKLWEDSYDKIGLDVPDNSLRIRSELPKYANFYHDKFQTKSYPIRGIFVLDTVDSFDEINLSKLNKMQAFVEIQRNCYRPFQLQSMNKKATLLPIAAYLAENKPVYKMVRSVQFNTTTRMVALIKSIAADL